MDTLRIANQNDFECTFKYLASIIKKVVINVKFMKIKVIFKLILVPQHTRQFSSSCCRVDWRGLSFEALPLKNLSATFGSSSANTEILRNGPRKDVRAISRPAAPVTVSGRNCTWKINKTCILVKQTVELHSKIN